MSTITRSTPAPGAQTPLDREELFSRDELEQTQLTRLRTTVRAAYERVPHYREAFDDAGVHPDDLRELSDIARFPLTEKEDLRRNYPFGMLAVPREKLSRVHASSGTTGSPTVVGYTAADLDVWATLVARSLRAAGIRPGQMVHNAYGYGLFTGGLGAHAGIERLGCTVVPISGGNTERQIQLIRDFQPDAILSTPTYLLTLVDALREAGLDPRDSSLRVGVLGAEPWTNEMRRAIEEGLGIDALDIYGLSEVMGPGVGSECVESKDGPHVWEDHFLPEVLDLDTGLPVPDGEEGELVITTLTKQGMPMIRYRTRDITRLLPGTARPGMRRIEKITGRNDDMIILRGVNLFPTQIEELVLRLPALAPHFLLELSRPGRMDQLTVQVEAQPGTGAGASDSAAETLAATIKARIGISARVRLNPSGSLARSTGKTPRLLDLRP